VAFDCGFVGHLDLLLDRGRPPAAPFRRI